jgi:hypothetical protein
VLWPGQTFELYVVSGLGFDWGVWLAAVQLLVRDEDRIHINTLEKMPYFNHGEILASEYSEEDWEVMQPWLLTNDPEGCAYFS